MVVTTNVFQKTLDKNDFGLTADKTIPAATWTELCAYTVPAQQEIAVGATEVIQGGVTGKVAYIRLDNCAGNQITPLKIRIKVEDANDMGQTITEHSAEEWSGSKTSRTDGLLLHKDSRVAVEDSKIKVYVYSASAVTVAYVDADTVIQLPVTISTVRR